MSAGVRPAALNSRSANALACALRFDEIKQGRRFLPEPSRLFIYFNERVVAGVVKEDAPVSLRDGYRTITKFGACPEHMWPYHVVPPLRVHAIVRAVMGLLDHAAGLVEPLCR